MTSIIVYILLALSVVGGVVYEYEHIKDLGRSEQKAVEAKNKAEENAATEKRKREEVQTLFDKSEDLGKERFNENAKLKTANATLAEKIKKLGGKSAIWLDAPVDTDVRRLRLDAYGTTSTKQGTGIVLRPAQGTAANPGAAAERREERPVAAGSERQPGRDSNVQQRQAGRVETDPVAKPVAPTSETLVERINKLRGLAK